jgi:hypothetical protein
MNRPVVTKMAPPAAVRANIRAINAPPLNNRANAAPASVPTPRPETAAPHANPPEENRAAENHVDKQAERPAQKKTSKPAKKTSKPEKDK